MAERYYIAADGGGTKLLAVLYDEERNVISSSKTHGTNQLFRPKEAMLGETEQLASELIPDYVRRVESVDFSIVGDPAPFLDAVRRRCEIGRVRGYGEGGVALASAGVKYGVAAQAGTGSDAFLIQPDKRDAVGGWGMTLGDEGGGYDIGLKTLRAAVWAEDGRGVPSVLPALLKETWGMSAVHFGLMMVMNLCVGTLTPPVGAILFAGCRTHKVKIEQIIGMLLPFFIVILASLLLVTYVPWFTMAIPTALDLV